MVKGSEIARAMDKLSEAEEVLAQTIPPEAQPILKRLTEAQVTLTALFA